MDIDKYFVQNVLLKPNHIVRNSHNSKCDELLIGITRLIPTYRCFYSNHNPTNTVSCINVVKTLLQLNVFAEIYFRHISVNTHGCSGQRCANMNASAMIYIVTTFLKPSIFFWKYGDYHICNNVMTTWKQRKYIVFVVSMFPQRCCNHVWT